MSAWSVPVRFVEDDGHVIAELKGSIHGIFGVGRTQRAALADLREAIREFACVTGAVPCGRHQDDE